jgi:hypothetical protein
MIHVPWVRGRLTIETHTWAVFHDQAQLNLISSDDESYHKALVNWWSEPEDLIIVEQDIVPAPGVVKEMLACSRDWCCSPYLIAGKLLIHNGLGCVKFSKSLRQTHPDMAQQAGVPCGEDEPPNVWWQLDARLAHLLMSAGYYPHPHQQSIHLH